MAKLLKSLIKQSETPTLGEHADSKHFDRANQLRDARSWNEAAVEYAAGLELRADNEAVWVQLGHCLKEAGRRAEAGRAYEQAVSRGSTDQHALDFLAEQAMRSREWSRAAGFYTRLLAKHPDKGYAHIQLGHALKESGDYTKAKAAYQAAERLDPDDVALVVQFGHLFARMGKVNEALGAYGRALAQGSRDEFAARYLAQHTRLEPALRGILRRVRPEVADTFVVVPDDAPPLNFTHLMLHFERQLPRSHHGANSLLADTKG